MSTLRIKQAIDSGFLSLNMQYDTSTVSSEDLALLKAYPEPLIDVGGTITVTTEDPPYVMTLPQKMVTIYSSFPMTLKFDSKSPPFNVNTSDRVEQVRDTIIQRLQAAFTQLRTMPLDYIGEKLYEI